MSSFSYGSSSSGDSGWESVQYDDDDDDQDFDAPSPRRATKSADVPDDESPSAASAMHDNGQKVIVELPPGGLALESTVNNKEEKGENPKAAGAEETKANDASLNSSFVQNFSGVLNLQSAPQEGHPKAFLASEGDAASSSAMSSFVGVPAPMTEQSWQEPSSGNDNDNPQGKLKSTGLMSCSSSISSSWSQVHNPLQQHSGIVSSVASDTSAFQQPESDDGMSFASSAYTNTYIHYNDNTTPHNNNTSPARKVIQNCELITLVAGEVEFLKCQRCHFHNERVAKSCEMCQLPFVVVPRQQQGDDNALLLEDAAGHYIPLSNEQDCKLLTELQTFLGPYYGASSVASLDQRSQIGPSGDSCPFCPLPEADLYHRLVQFCSIIACMKSSNEFYKISLQYKLVLIPKPPQEHGNSDTRMAQVWKAIGSRGFARDSAVGFKEPIWVASALEGAWNRAEREVEDVLLSKMSNKEWANARRVSAPKTKLMPSLYTSTYDTTTMQFFAAMPPILENILPPEASHVDTSSNGDEEEEDDDEEIAWAWIVAVAESTSDAKKTREAPNPPSHSSAMGRRRSKRGLMSQDVIGTGSNRGKVTDIDLPEQVLPLVCFDPKTHGASDEIRVLMNGLSRVFWNFTTTSNNNNHAALSATSPSDNTNDISLGTPMARDVASEAFSTSLSSVNDNLTEAAVASTSVRTRGRYPGNHTPMSKAMTSAASSSSSPQSAFQALRKERRQARRNEVLAKNRGADAFALQGNFDVNNVLTSKFLSSPLAQAPPPKDTSLSDDAMKLRRAMLIDDRQAQARKRRMERLEELKRKRSEMETSSSLDSSPTTSQLPGTCRPLQDTAPVAPVRSNHDSILHTRIALQDMQEKTLPGERDSFGIPRGVAKELRLDEVAKLHLVSMGSYPNTQ